MVVKKSEQARLTDGIKPILLHGQRANQSHALKNGRSSTPLQAYSALGGHSCSDQDMDVLNEIARSRYRRRW